MKISLVLLVLASLAYIEYSSAFVPAACKEIIAECEKHGPQVVKWLKEECCKCGPVSFKRAKKWIDAAIDNLPKQIIPYVCEKIPKLKGKLPPNKVSEIAHVIENDFGKCDNLCNIEPKKSPFKEMIEKAKQDAISKAMPLAMKLLSLAGECSKGKKIPEHIMHLIPSGQQPANPVNILALIKSSCKAMCATPA